MRTKVIFARFIVIAILCSISGIGCTNSSSGSGSVSSTGPTAAKVDEAKQLVTKLKAMPPEQRQAYVAQHQDLVDALNRSGDTTLRNEFMQLMMPQRK